MALSDFLTALRGAPADIQAIDKQLHKLYAERDALKKAPPHIDDVKAWALRGLDTASEDFLGRLKRWRSSLPTATTYRWCARRAALGRSIGCLADGPCPPPRSSRGRSASA